jgi:hypothetical protein
MFQLTLAVSCACFWHTLAFGAFPGGVAVRRAPEPGPSRSERGALRLVYTPLPRPSAGQRGEASATPIERVENCGFLVELLSGDSSGRPCRCLNLSTSMEGTRSKVEGEDRHDLEPEGTCEDTRHEIYTGSGSRSSYPTSCLG